MFSRTLHFSVETQKWKVEFFNDEEKEDGKALAEIISMHECITSRRIVYKQKQNRKTPSKKNFFSHDELSNKQLRSVFRFGRQHFLHFCTWLGCLPANRIFDDLGIRWELLILLVSSGFEVILGLLFPSFNHRWRTRFLNLMAQQICKLGQTWAYTTMTRHKADQSS